MKNLLFGVIILFFIGCAQPSDEYAEEPVSDEPSYSFVEGHAPVWEQATQQIMELADAMPDYSFKPHDSVRTFAEQLVHIGGSSKVIANMFLKDIQPAGPPPDMDISAMSKDEIKSMVKANLEETWEIMSSMSDEQLGEEIKSFSGNTMTRREGLMLVHDHLTNHKAKANLICKNKRQHSA